MKTRVKAKISGGEKFFYLARFELKVGRGMGNRTGSRRCDAKPQIPLDNAPFLCYHIRVSKQYAGMAELADAQDLGSCVNSCRFKSCHPHQKYRGGRSHLYIFGPVLSSKNLPNAFGVGGNVCRFAKQMTDSVRQGKLAAEHKRSMFNLSCHPHRKHSLDKLTLLRYNNFV